MSRNTLSFLRRNVRQQKAEIMGAMIDNVVVAPIGSAVYGRLAQAKSASNMSGGAELTLELTEIVINGRAYPFLTSTYRMASQGHGSKNAKKVVGGTGLGAHGGIAGGGKGAAIGAGVGAVAGTTASAATNQAGICAQRVSARIPSATISQPSGGGVDGGSPRP
jgi:hypothetical protein